MGDTIIVVKKLSKSFKGEAVLKSLDLELEAGKCYGFTGKNGSGKSVFFKLLLGLILPDHGEIHFWGKKLGKEIDFAPDAGVMIEHPGFIENYSGFKNLKYLSKIKNVIDDAQIKASMIQTGLDPESKKAVKNYSLGMKQRLALAQAIMENPKILVLDEPMNGLDEEGVHEIRTLLIEKKQQGTTLLISSHIAEDIQSLCDEVYKFEKGQLFPSNE
ncbi:MULTISPECIES: ATP-binding cassette domain-containing protein [Saccharibacillus]|uniref:ATP-binding cassette domain-containing protein n=1 Tax=Saccharibacillus TaxID=456492 RepID=UPI0019250B67|nr:ATP-binding cassette domain-containing protein [Saccharibacillus sp. WB 17]